MFEPSIHRNFRTENWKHYYNLDKIYGMYIHKMLEQLQLLVAMKKVKDTHGGFTEDMLKQHLCMEMSMTC